MLLLDVSPLSQGIELIGGIMSTVIPRNSTIPCQKSQMYTTDHDNQVDLEIEVYEGERGMTKDNHKLGTFWLKGIPKAAQGVAQIEVTFDVDSNGILKVDAHERASGKKSNVTISNDRARLSPEEIEALVADAEKYKVQDEKIKDRIEARNLLEQYCYTMQTHLADEKMGKAFNNKDRGIVEASTAEMLMWI